jgi:hypothetical protein
MDDKAMQAGVEAGTQAGDSHYSHQYNGRKQWKLNSKHFTVYPPIQNCLV